MGIAENKLYIGRDRRLDRMDEVKMKIDFAMDADQFKNKIQDTQVLYIFITASINARY